jgi:hypothetical protein
VDKIMTFASKEGIHFWSNGSAWGKCRVQKQNKEFNVELAVKGGKLELNTFILGETGQKHFDGPPKHIGSGEKIQFRIPLGKNENL